MTRWKVSAMVVMVVGLVTFELSRAEEDWWKRCVEYPDAGDNETSYDLDDVTSQTCENPVNCSTNAVACKAGVSQCYDEGGATTHHEVRVSQVGDCESTETYDPQKHCYYCDNSYYVCGASYLYKQFAGGQCADRCEYPLGIYTELGNCRP